MKSILRLKLILFAMATGALLAYAQQPVRNGVYKYRFVIPDGWEEIPAQRLTAINSRIPAHTNIKFSIGYQPKNLIPAPDGSTLPLILVQNEKKTVSGTYEEVERSLAKKFGVSVRSVEGNSGQMIAAMQHGSAILDRSKNRVVQRLEGGALGGDFMGQKIEGVSYGFLGKNGITFFDCYARGGDFEACLPAFNAAADSFQYEEGEAFVSGQTAPRNWVAIIGGCCVAGVFVVAGISYVIYYVWTRSQER